MIMTPTTIIRRVDTMSACRNLGQSVTKVFCVIELVVVKEVFGVTEILGLGWHLFLRMRHDARITPIVAHNT